MKTRSKWIALASAFGLTALCVGAALATGGDQNDPLVTLSYLEQTALPGVVEQVEIKSTARQAELEKADVCLTESGRPLWKRRWRTRSPSTSRRSPLWQAQAPRAAPPIPWSL